MISNVSDSPNNAHAPAPGTYTAAERHALRGQDSRQVERKLATGLGEGLIAERKMPAEVRDRLRFECDTVAAVDVDRLPASAVAPAVALHGFAPMLRDG
jgi:hypothetical protein